MDDLLTRLDTEIATVRGELARTENKAGNLLTIAVAGLTVLVAVGTGRHLDPAAAATGAAAVLAVMVGVVLLGLVLYPRLDRRRSGWLAHGRRSTQQVLDALAGTSLDEERARQLRFLSRLAVGKFQLIQAAELVLGLAVLLALAAAAL